jgi:hypothetical protein
MPSPRLALYGVNAAELCDLRRAVLEHRRLVLQARGDQELREHLRHLVCDTARLVRLELVEQERPYVSPLAWA